MAVDDRQIARILVDADKRIIGDLRWADDEDQSCGLEFSAPLAAPDPLLVRGQRCDPAGSLRFALILRGVGRIAALHLGHAHQGPDGRRCDALHVHRWSPPFRDHLAVPVPMGPDAPDPVAHVWHIFLKLMRITHEGVLTAPPPRQETLL